MDSSNPAMGGMTGDNSFLRDPVQQQQPSPYGVQASQGAQQQQQQPVLQPSVFTLQSPATQQPQQHQHQQRGMMYSNQYGAQPQQQQPMMQSTPPYQQQQQASPYNFSPPPQPVGPPAMSSMVQHQVPGGAYGNMQQQQQQPTPPVSQINVPIRQQQVGGGISPTAPAPGSFAARSQAMQQQNQQKVSAPSTNDSSIYSSVAGGSDNLYPPSPQRAQTQPQQSGGMMTPQSQQQQQQPVPGSFAARQAAMMGQGQPQQPQQQAPSPGSFAQRQAAMMGQGQPQQQQQQAPAPGSFAQRQAAMMGQPQQQQASVAGSFAQRQAAMMGQGQQQFQQQPGGMTPQQQQQQQFQQPGQPQQQFQQPGMSQRPQQSLRPMLVDPPEVIAQQQRLLTEATRKVQEHAYYMKQAIDRHDLPVVLDRAASMVGELGEHAHSNNNHKMHPPAPGATGTSTALQPKNYYELHLRALEELPTLENYLLDVANASKQHAQIQQQQTQGSGIVPSSGSVAGSVANTVNGNTLMQQQQQHIQGPGVVPSSGSVAGSVANTVNSNALMQQLTGDPNAMSNDNFMNAPQPNNMNPNPNNPLGAGPGPGVYSNVMGGNNAMQNYNNPMMANSQNAQMGMGMSMSQSGMMMPGQHHLGQSMMNSSIVPPAPAISYTMMELYDCVQYCPNVLSRLYLQICAASALIRSGEVGARWVFKDLIEAVKCVQNPVRGLFLRHYLLQAFRDKLPDVGIPIDQIGSLIRGTSSSTPAAPSGEAVIPLENVSTPAPKISDSEADLSDKGTVKDSYEFVLANFIEMNKLWVRIQHLPGDQRTKAVRRRREKDRNELRILVGTNLVRLSALDTITSTIYGQVILPTVLDQIVICADPLSQAYLLDCIVQVFPDEYHIETMPILLAVCPKLRDKVNIRTILHSLMTRLANYLADEELLDEKDSNEVKRAVALDSFRMFDECVQNVYNARGPKLNAKEVIRLQTALLEFSMNCYKGNLEQITLCLKNCVAALQQARDNAAYLMPPPPPQQQYGQPQMQPPPPPPTSLEPVATKELEKLLSIPLKELALGVLTLDHYSDLIGFLPWNNRREVALNMLQSVIDTGKVPESVREIEELFSVIAPVLRGENDAPVPESSSAEVERTTNLMAGLGVSMDPQQQMQQQQYGQPQMMQQQGFQGGVGVDPIQYQNDSALISKFIGMLDNRSTDVLFEMLEVAQKHLNAGQSDSNRRVGSAHAALVFAALKLARKVFRGADEEESPAPLPTNEETNTDADASAKTKTEADAPAVTKEATSSAQQLLDALTSNDVGEENEELTEAKVDTVEEKETTEVKVETVEEEDGEATENVEEDKKPAAKVEEETKNPVETADVPKVSTVTTCRKIFVYVVQAIGYIGQVDPEKGIKLYLEAALTADKLGVQCESDDEKQTYGSIVNQLFTLCCNVYEERASKDMRLQRRCVMSMIGRLVACRSLEKVDYEQLTMTISKFSAKMTKQSEQCEMVTRCSHLFYLIDDDGSTVVYANAQRSLECLQRSLKLANACTTADVSNLRLFVDLLQIYIFFFEKNNPLITGNYITGLVALIKEHAGGIPMPQGGGPMAAAADAKNQYLQLVRYIKQMKTKPESTEKFKAIDVSSVET